MLRLSRAAARALSTAPAASAAVPLAPAFGGSPRAAAARAAAAFPSLRVGRGGVSAHGTFAEAQAEYLEPCADDVARLVSVLRIHSHLGVVAHYYMDPQIQGALAAAARADPNGVGRRIFLGDSLAMGAKSVEMAAGLGVTDLVCLGVDFMAESSRAALDAAGHASVGVYRAAAAPIGCSLAEAAERDGYRAWLRKAGATPNALHVVYINTSLTTKAEATSMVPTIACTSGNVLRTVLQAAAQIPHLSLWYGPDTYMGENLKKMLSAMAASFTDAQVAAVHPAHDRASVARLVANFHSYQQGACVVHHMFGDEVARRVAAEHPDAHLTAHLEVPGEMFDLAHDAAARGKGACGSTQDILNYIGDTTAEAARKARHAPAGTAPPPPSFVLGTEAGMVTAIVHRVADELAKVDAPLDYKVEIVFPVAEDAVTGVPCDEEAPFGLQVVPGVQSGEGCSTGGGCATCAFMKMNTLDGAMALLDRLGAAETAADRARLAPFASQRIDKAVGGAPVAELGARPIIHMRDFMAAGELSSELVEAVRRGGSS